jgi:hypothetical protein
VRAAAVSCAAIAAVLAFAAPAGAATFTVNNPADTDDGTCDLADCTLDEAIDAANTDTVHDTILFNVAGPVTTTGVVVTQRVTIDGGSPRTEVAGSFDVLSLNVAGSQPSTIRNLVIRGPNANFGVGIRIASSAPTVVENNFIGTNAAGTVGSGHHSGVLVEGTGAVTIRGNLISDNVRGISIGLGSDHLIEGNRIGTDASGTATLPNVDGVHVPAGTASVTVGGTAAGAGNLISGNAANGVAVAADASLVEGNVIGLDATGTAALGNDEGVHVSGGVAQVGGTAAGAANVVSGNRIGVHHLNGTAVVQGNRIGTRVDGTGSPASGNTQYGIVSNEFASGGLTVGGVGPGANVIAFNGFALPDGPGVLLPPVGGRQILGNSVYSNDGLGIDATIAGPSVNDSPDADGVQNHPLIASASGDAASTQISGTLSSTPLTSFRLEFFTGDACSLGGRGQGRTFLGARTAVTTGGGDVSFSYTLPGGAGAPAVTATATRADPIGSTSEFSPCVAVTPLPTDGGGETDGGGGTDGGGQTPPPPSPQPAPSPQPPPSPPPSPETGETFNVAAERGTVTVRLPDGRTVVLDETVQIVTGSVVDTRKGTVRLTGEGAGGNIETGVFSHGLFRVTQTKGKRPVTDLKLVEKLARCPKRGKAAAAAKRKRKRRLWGDANGTYRTRGRYGNAINNGTKWLIEDRCDGTLFRVARGSIRVRRNGSNRAVRLRAGDSRLVKRPR